MKLLRVGAVGAEKPAMLDAAGQIRDLSGVIPDFTSDVLSDAGLAKLRALDPATLPVVSGTPRVGPCVPRPVNYVCIGLNYADHAAETGGKAPKEPIIFLKSLGAYQGPTDDVVRPRGSTKLDWEVELGVVIGKPAKYITEAEVFDHIAGYCVCNDVSEREFQIERSGTWDKGKGCDTFGPTGPWLVTRDEVPDPQSLKLWLDVDGTRRQDGTTANMIFNVVQLVSYVSQFMTLHPGDIIATGTPAGVGLGHKPPLFLEPGQTMIAGIEGLGEQHSKVLAG
jgi:2-keto-4-pentenoate hydratase/2-oxohepta-3-ene-1,7-dioic acid hydratase in catechol pathway